MAASGRLTVEFEPAGTARLVPLDPGVDGSLAAVAAGVALATVAAAGIAGGGRITADLELRRSLEAVPRADRSFSATWLGAPPAAGYGVIDREATRTLAVIQPGAPARTVSYPELN